MYNKSKCTPGVVVVTGLGKLDSKQHDNDTRIEFQCSSNWIKRAMKSNMKKEVRSMPTDPKYFFQNLHIYIAEESNLRKSSISKSWIFVGWGIVQQQILKKKKPNKREKLIDVDAPLTTVQHNRLCWTVVGHEYVNHALVIWTIHGTLDS